MSIVCWTLLKGSSVLAAAMACWALAAGCGSSDEASTSSGASAGPTGSGSSAGADVVAEAKKVTAASFEGKVGPLPESGPKAVPDKTVWAVMCTAQGPGCLHPAKAAVEAGKELGWNMKLLDGKQDPKLWNAHLRSAAVAGVDAVIMFGFDCAPVASSIEEAQAAGVKVFVANGLDCDDRFASGGEPLFDDYLRFGPNDAGYDEFAADILGPAMANWLIAETDGKAKVIELQEDDVATARHVGEAFHSTMERCADCEVWQLPHTAADIFNGKLQSKVVTALTQHPDADAVMAPLDISVTLGAAPAVEQARASGRDILLIGQEGNPENIKLIRQGVQSYATGRPMEWTGWAAIDGVNRMFAGDEQVDAGMRIRPVDADHLPDGSLDDQVARVTGFKENYKRIWGVG